MYENLAEIVAKARFNERGLRARGLLTRRSEYLVHNLMPAVRLSIASRFALYAQSLAAALFTFAKHTGKAAAGALPLRSRP